MPPKPLNGPPTCHPDRPYHAKGKCKECYTYAAHLRRMENLEFRKANQKRSRDWAIANPERAYILDANKHLMKKYGITLKDYHRMFEEQKGVCKICGEPPTLVLTKRVARLHVDHCHDTGRIRGLLCLRCNTGLSMFDNKNVTPEIVERYLKEAK